MEQKLNTVITTLHEKASHLNKLNTNDEALYEYVNLNKPNLKEVLETYKPINEFKPVNTLRFLIANELEKGRLINHNKIEELKQALEDRNVSSYYQLDDTVNQNLSKYKRSKKGMFPNWKQAYKVLFPFIHNSSENEETKAQLTKIADGIIKKSELKNISKHIVTFQGPNNYGEDRVWLAIMPKSASSVKNAYQLFFTIDVNGISGGIHKGHNLPKDNFTNENRSFETLEDYISHTKEVKEKWSRLNSEINHFLLFGQIEKKFEAFLYKFVAEGTAKTYLSAMRSIEKLSKNEGININSIYQFTDSVSFKNFSENLKQIDTYNKTNAKHHNRYSSALLKYEEFLAYKSEDIMSEKSNTPQPLNQILFGPPGTGKTYETIKKAVQIANPDFDIKQNRELIKAEYDRLVEREQIQFTTFHQSMSYEDFVEGIKPVFDSEDESKLGYQIEDGIFKKIVNKAKGVKGEIKNTQTVDFRNCNYFKMSLGGKNRKYIHDWCIKNNLIALGWGGKNNLKSHSNKDWTTYRDNFKKNFPELVENSTYNIVATHAFLDWMKIGDIVLVSLGNNIIDAVGVITGEYEFLENEKHHYYHTRKVNWIATNLEADPSLFVDKKISQQSIYQFNNDDIKIDYLEETFKTDNTSNKTENHVLIIDEINRGNVSAIFGELITLLEDTKRSGNNNSEALKVKLPYSKKDFSVPDNLYVIGTMNTADRSVEALDTALRRRFHFEEMMPNYELPELETDLDIDLKTLLKTINKRIEVLLDREYQIGHSYLLNIENEKHLLDAFQNKIIPLLQEYFYNDYEKIRLVIGDQFITKENTKINFAVTNTDYETKAIYTWKELNENNIIDNVTSIYSTETSNE